jgi:hypothetical protein
MTGSMNDMRIGFSCSSQSEFVADPAMGVAAAKFVGAPIASGGATRRMSQERRRVFTESLVFSLEDRHLSAAQTDGGPFRAADRICA